MTPGTKGDIEEMMDQVGRMEDTIANACTILLGADEVEQARRAAAVHKHLSAVVHILDLMLVRAFRGDRAEAKEDEQDG